MGITFPTSTLPVFMTSIFLFKINTPVRKRPKSRGLVTAFVFIISVLSALPLFRRSSRHRPYHSFDLHLPASQYPL